MPLTKQQLLRREYRAAIAEYHCVTNYLTTTRGIVSKPARELLKEFADLAKRKSERLRRMPAPRRSYSNIVTWTPFLLRSTVLSAPFSPHIEPSRRNLLGQVCFLYAVCISTVPDEIPTRPLASHASRVGFSQFSSTHAPHCLHGRATLARSYRGASYI
jgi:hypothetical protein